MPTNPSEYQKQYMRKYRKMMKEARRKRLELGLNASSACEEFRGSVLDVWEGRRKKTYELGLFWNNHMVHCDACAKWFVENKPSKVWKGVNMWGETLK